MTNSRAQSAQRVVEQEIWRAVHHQGAVAALSTEGLAALRCWTAVRLREHSYAAVDRRRRPPVMRATFIDAISHAASEIAAGRTPE